MIRAAAIAFAGGAWLLQQQARLLPAGSGAALFVLPVLAWGALRLPVAARRAVLIALAFAAGFVWADWRASLRIADALPAQWEGRDLVLVGVVQGLPVEVDGIGAPGLRFAFAVEHSETPGAVVPTLISLGWYARPDAPLPALAPGQRWRLQVRLKRPHGSANPYGFDVERWLLEQSLRATGTVRPAPAVNRKLADFVVTPATLIDRARHRIAEHIRAALPRADAPYAGVMVALVVGEQRGIANDDWTVFNRTGIGHLLSISGLHITMLAALAAACAAFGWRIAARRGARWAMRIGRAQAAALAGFCAALVYTLLAGFAVPAQRTLWMLAVVAAALWMQRGTRPSYVLAAALALVVALDPWAVDAPGLWLSFGAVAALMYAGLHAGAAGRVEESGKESGSESRAEGEAEGGAEREAGAPPWWRHWCARAWAALRAAAHAQLAVTCALLPLTVLFFQQVSLVGPLANAVAIPVVSFVVTPLALFGGLVGTVFGFDWPLHWAHAAFAALAVPLQALAQWSAANLEWPAPGFAAALAALLGLAWLAAPRGVPARAAGVGLLLPVLLTQYPAPAPGALRATALDVGQGMAVLIETAHHRLLYDTGPRYTDDADAGNRVLVPHLRAIGAPAIDGLVISHADQDHAGGAMSVLAERTVGWVLSPLPPRDPVVAAARAAHACVRGLRWQWDGVEFEVLHPDTAQQAAALRSNAGSCVLRVAAGAHALLLAGDIEAAQEAELVARDTDALRADVLLVPHHGSASSSSVGFIAAVHPRLAIFQVGYRNRFGHPRAEVLARYVAAGTAVARSDRDGAIVVELSSDGLQWHGWRAQAPRYWHALD